jgi:hypothetical protein
VLKLKINIEQTKSGRVIPAGKFKLTFWETGIIPAGNSYSY